jgi:hypothetical protein
MIILEGPDGGGKSMLTPKIVRRWHGRPPDNYDVQVTHSPGPLDNGLYEWAIKALKNAKPVCILDRFPYFSESVYGPVLRQRPCMSTAEFVALRERLLKIRPLVIYCRPPVTTLHVSRLVRDQMSGVLEHYDEIVAAYDRGYAHWIRDFRILQYDFTRGEEADRILSEAIKAYVLEEQRGEIM